MKISELNKTNISAIACTLCAAILTSGCHQNKDNEKATAPQTAPEVVTALPLIEDVEIVNTYSARVAPAEYVEIRARVGGYLEKKFFKGGEIVKKGETLFLIDDRPYTIALEAAKANVSAAQSKISLCKDNAERARALFAKNAVSKEIYQTRETELLLANAKLLEANAAKRNAELNFEFTRVTSPISGKISENYVDIGNLIAPNSTKLARVVDNSTVKVYFELNAADAARYNKDGLLKAIDNGNGATAELVMKNDSSIHKGKLTYRDNALGMGTSSLVIRADIDNNDETLMAGSFGDIHVKEGFKKNAILVPDEIVGTDLTGRYVLTLLPDNTVKQNVVVTGIKVRNLRVIEHGLDPNSRVIIAGVQRVKIGGKATPKESQIK